MGSPGRCLCRHVDGRARPKGRSASDRPRRHPPLDPPLDLDILLVSCGRSEMHPASEPSTFAELVFYLAFGIVLLIIGAICRPDVAPIPARPPEPLDHSRYQCRLRRYDHRLGDRAGLGDAGGSPSWLYKQRRGVRPQPVHQRREKASGRRSSAAAPNIPYARAGTPSRSSCPGCNFQVEFDGLKAKLLGSTSSP
jgi:hypothetical protein